ncbi:tetratricopeptide repeat-containing sulfotransferase family protein [Vulcaniibacterium tengchongense]|uniref:tetratricopeptide repeat-containing sulfotransferase family protein n=1 Tax=Vulcaniibacterium tengchongense TaxID=1273429 RepID=UPI000F4EC2C2|nr:sulfotransferase [Vulcaniibacterium tengchongense]
MERALSLLAGGKAAEVEHMAAAVLRGGHDPVWATVLGLSLGAQGRHADAAALFRALAEREPAVPEHRINLGNAYLHLGEPENARASFAAAERSGLDGVEFRLGYGLALLACGAPEQARVHLAAAFRLGPAADTALPYAQCLCELERFDQAARIVAGLRPAALTARQREALAWVYAQTGQDRAACELYQALLEACPDRGDLRVDFALLLERINRLEDAETQLAHPSVLHGRASATRSLACARVARRRQRYEEASAWLEQGLALGPNPALTAVLNFELAKAYEAQRREDRVMRALRTAHAALDEALKSRSIAQADLGWLGERLQQPAPREWRRPFADASPADPVFLVGFPRSGTTLLENVLDSHPGLAALDEWPALETAIEALRPVARLAAAATADVVSARKRYWAEVAQRMPLDPAVRLVDKYPLYLTRLPYIARLFPEAKLVVLLRHPCDCVLSCYMQSFGVNGGAASFSSLERAADTYAAVMAYWNEQRHRVELPAHVLRYEDLVADFDGEIARVLAFLGLAWAEGMGRYRTAKAERGERIRTPSYHQVVEPVHRHASERWRRYRAYFSERTLETLAPFAREYGYTVD